MRSQLHHCLTRSNQHPSLHSEHTMSMCCTPADTGNHNGQLALQVSVTSPTGVLHYGLACVHILKCCLLVVPCAKVIVSFMMSMYVHFVVNTGNSLDNSLWLPLSFQLLREALYQPTTTAQVWSNCPPDGTILPWLIDCLLNGLFYDVAVSHILLWYGNGDE